MKLADFFQQLKLGLPLSESVLLVPDDGGDPPRLVHQGLVIRDRKRWCYQGCYNAKGYSDAGEAIIWVRTKTLGYEGGVEVWRDTPESDLQVTLMHELAHHMDVSKNGFDINESGLPVESHSGTWTQEYGKIIQYAERKRLISPEVAEGAQSDLASSSDSET